MMLLGDQPLLLINNNCTTAKDVRLVKLNEAIPN